MGLGSWSRNEWAEAKEAGREIGHFVRTHNWKKSARGSVRRKYWSWWIFTILLTAAIVLLAIYRDTIIKKFEPHKQDIVDLPVSWLIPIGVLIILSFPPLGGHEIVLMVAGLIWGLWIGFGIAAAGTFIGEVLCFWGFKYLFTNKANQIESKSIFYACIARLMRQGGIGIIIIVRFSAVPGHVVTAIQSTVGMSIWVYSLAIIVSMPKQLAVVYLGYMFGITKETASPAQVRKQKIISLSVFFGTAIATVLSLYIVYMRARKLYPEVLRDMEEASLAKSPLADDSGAEATHRLERRRSLVDAAFEGEPGSAAREEFVARENRDPRAHGMVRTHSGGTWPSDVDGDTSTDGEWDAKSPAMRRGASGGGDRHAQPWQDGRPAQGSAPVDYRGRAADAPADKYGHLPLASESEVGGAYPSYGEIPYVAPGNETGGRGGKYGSTGR